MTACTFFEVAPPSRTPSSDNLLITLERAGLIRSDDTNGRWIGGIQFRPRACGGGGIHVDNCAFNGESPDSPGEDASCSLKVFNSFHDAVAFRSMNVFASVHCSTFSDSQDITDQALEQFNISRDPIVAFELMYGQSNRLEVTGETCDDGDPMPQNPFIADALDNSFPTSPDGNWVNAATLDPVAGMALILDTIANTANGVEAVLHISPGLAAVWVALDLIERDGAGNLRTVVGGHLVLAAPGYVGGTPLDDTDAGSFDGHSPGFVSDGGWWVYVTGAVGSYLGERSDEQTLEHRRNNYFTVVEQFVLPYFDPTCPRFAIPVGRDCSSLEIDWSDPGSLVPIEQVFNDHLITCVDPDGGNEGTPMDPAIFIGVDYPASA